MLDFERNYSFLSFMELLVGFGLKGELIAIMRKIAIVSTKGGSGKTTTSVNLAHALALKGKEVLLIDSDPQDSIGIMFNVNPQKNLADLFLKKKTSIVKVREKLHLISSGGVGISQVEKKIGRKFRKEYLLKKSLSHLEGVDYVIIDCAPSLGIININILTYCDEVIVPIAMDFLSQIGANQVLGLIDMVASMYNRDLELLGVLPVFYNEETEISKDAIKMLKSFFKDKLFSSRIREDMDLRIAPSYMKTIFDYNPQAKGAEDYRSLAKEIDEH